MTPLDAAHARMAQNDGDEAARRGFYAALAATEVFLALEEPPAGQSLKPLVLQTADGPLALAFDTEARLAAFLPNGAAYAAMAGRQLAQMLADAGIGLGLNLDVAPSSILLEPAALAWLVEMAAALPRVRAGQIQALQAPDDPPEALVALLTARLPILSGLATRAWLAGAAYGDGETGLLLCIEGAATGTEPAISRAMSEALSIGGFSETVLDVAFYQPGDPAFDALPELALRLDIPDPEPAGLPTRDPDTPPRLI